MTTTKQSQRELAERYEAKLIYTRAYMKKRHKLMREAYLKVFGKKIKKGA